MRHLLAERLEARIGLRLWRGIAVPGIAAETRVEIRKRRGAGEIAGIEGGLGEARIAEILVREIRRRKARLAVARVPAAAEDSLGAAVQLGGLVGDSAQEAFVNAMSTASLVVAAVAALGAAMSWMHLRG